MIYLDVPQQLLKKLDAATGVPASALGPLRTGVPTLAAIAQAFAAAAGALIAGAGEAVPASAGGAPRPRWV
jgi:hypothetical protein